MGTRNMPSLSFKMPPKHFPTIKSLGSNPKFSFSPDFSGYVRSQLSSEREQVVIYSKNILLNRKDDIPGAFHVEICSSPAGFFIKVGDTDGQSDKLTLFLQHNEMAKVLKSYGNMEELAKNLLISTA